ncbi:transcription factor bHLH149-like [Prosopis cineraria]|uniref:transcription factor bHLH149-like n=1 Tax=Prosopis cineraria TaxID=364024 RepID=UPI00240EF389|nr:transcription factor bHLH149-like [Prosopis cineraria]
MASLQPDLDSIHSDTSPPSSLRKRTKFGPDSSRHNSLHPVRWRSDADRRIYSSKLVEALRHVLHRSPSLPPRPVGGHEIHETADRVLATTAKGRTRWSRAILASPLGRWRFQRQHKKVKKTTRGFKKPEIRKDRRLPALHKKACVLGRLVPGCRKVSFPNLLEETSDYISALEMQVRVMTALTELLAGGGVPADRLEGPRP